LQVGTRYIPDIIKKLEDEFGRKWIYTSNQKEVIVQKHEEENNVSLYYDKEQTKIKLLFKDAYGKELKNSEIVDAQIGSEYSANLFNRIVGNDGARWQFEQSNPSTMVVKEANNTFTLIYGEIRGTVLIKYSSISGIKISDDIQAKARLGSIYVPNINAIIIDHNNKQWRYSGPTDISTLVNDNEQDNIIVLQYDEDKAKVTVKYIDMYGKQIREDITKDVQIGSEIKIEEKQVITDSNGLVWKLNNINNKTFKVTSDNSTNIAINKYEPLLADILLEFVDETENDIIDSKTIKAQVGSTYNIEIIDRITDVNDRVWIFNKTENTIIKMSEAGYNAKLIYSPLKALVTAMYVDEEGNKVSKEDSIYVQVGDVFIPKVNESIEDIDGKVWSYKGVNVKELVVSEDEQKNIIIYTFKKTLVTLKICFKTIYGSILKEDEIVKAQIGSAYVATPPLYLQDSDGLRWVIPDNNVPKFKVQNDEKKNLYEISYKEFIVNVYQRFENEAGQIIKEQVIEKRQVGDTYVANFEDVIIDESGKQWIYSHKDKDKDSLKIFASRSKADSLKVSEDEKKNIVVLKYKPLLTNVTIKFIDAFGNVINKDLLIKAQIGSEYQAEIIDNIMDQKGNKWTFNEKSNNKLIVKEDEKDNVIILAYEEQKANVTYKYEDEEGIRLKAPTKVLSQIGSIFKPQAENIIEDEQGRKWEFKYSKVESLKVNENEQENIFNLIYGKLTAEVLLKIYDLAEHQIISDIIVRAQIGSEFKPIIEDRLSDNESKLFKFVRCEPNSILVKETITENNDNVMKLIYEAVNTTVQIKYQDIDGNILKEDEILHVQVGTKYTATAIQYIKDRKENQWQLVNDSNGSIRTSENPKENIIKLVYEIAKTEVIVRYKDTEGNIIKDDDHYPEQIGNEFTPEILQTIIDNQGKKWSYFNAEPAKLKVGSINNVINLIYQEAKITVTLKYENEDGKKLRDEERILIQIGSRFKPKVTAKVIYDENEIWRYSKSSPQEITVTDNKEENVIILVYTDNKEFANTEEIITDKAKVVVEETPKAKEVESVTTNQNEKAEVSEQKNVESEADKELLKLERSINLSSSEKETIKKLNYYNDEIIKIVKSNLERFKNKEEYLEGNISNLIEKEKELVASGLKNIIQNDKTGNKLLKIFEHIAASEMQDKLFTSLQQRKTVLMADYFFNRPITDIEQANYICERGKNDKELELIEKKLLNEKETEEYAGIKCTLIYEKILLDNYYKGRTIIKDNYFKDEISKKSVPADLIIMVTNMLPKQAFGLLQRYNNLDKYRINELQAILLLFTTAQKSALETMINDIKDSRLRKDIQKFYKKL
jgi:hypothetical protein